MTKKKKIAAVIITIAAIPVVLFIGLMAYLGISAAKEKAEHEIRIKNAKRNAVSYVEEKYGVKGKVIDASIGRSGFFMDSWDTDEAVVTMSVGEREFDVWVQCLEESSYGYDNYQCEEIKKALEDVVNADIPGGTICDMCTIIEGSYSDGETKFGRYYNGSNLEEVLGDVKTEMTMYYINTDLHDCGAFDRLHDMGVEAEIVSIASQEIADEIIEQHGLQGIPTWDYAPYITNYRNIVGDRNDQRFFELENEGDFMIYQPFGEEKIEISFTDEGSGRYMYHGEDASFVIYYPVSLVNKEDNSGVTLMIDRANCKENTYNSEISIGSYGDYYVEHINAEEGMVFYLRAC